MILILRIVLEIHPKKNKWFKKSTNIPLLLGYLSYNFGIFTPNRPLTVCLSAMEVWRDVKYAFI